MTRIAVESPIEFRRSGRAVAGIGIVAILMSCSLFEAEPRVCTEIGCSSGLTVALEAGVSGPFTVELLPLPGGDPLGADFVYECAGGTTCNQEIFFAGMVAPGFLVRVTTGTGVRTTSFPDVEYTTVRPNGPGCEPECEQARVVASVPE